MEVVFTFRTSGDFHDGDEVIHDTHRLFNTQKIFLVGNDTYIEYIKYTNGEIGPDDMYRIFRNDGVDKFWLDTLLFIDRRRANIAVRNVPTRNELLRAIKRQNPNTPSIGKLKQRGLLLNRLAPMMIPYNVDINNTYDHCVTGWLKKHHPRNKKPYTGQTVQDLINYCDKMKVPCDIRNIFNKVVYKNDLTMRKHYPAIRGISHDEHWYPAEGKKKITLNNNIIVGQDETENYIYFTNNNNSVTDGVYVNEQHLNPAGETRGGVAGFDTGNARGVPGGDRLVFDLAMNWRNKLELKLVKEVE